MYVERGTKHPESLPLFFHHFIFIISLTSVFLISITSLSPVGILTPRPPPRQFHKSFRSHNGTPTHRLLSPSSSDLLPSTSLSYRFYNFPSRNTENFVVINTTRIISSLSFPFPFCSPINTGPHHPFTLLLFPQFRTFVL